MALFRSSIALLALVALTLASTCSADETVVTIADGTLQGEITPGGGARAFRGVPYAQPPVGKLRWADTQPSSPWSGVKNATVDGAACPQTCRLPPFACPPVQNEDCLYLNVFTPRLDAIVEPLPVMVFLHGGNFFQGYGGGPLYDGRFYGNHTQTIIVSINYRLGLLGFLHTPSINGSFGLRDQQMALRWVQTNIAAFGGDATRVTLFGQSAGAMSIAAHLQIDSSAGLFHRCIMESEPFSIPFRSPQDWSGLGQQMAKDLSCSYSDDDCLRSKSYQDVVQAQDALMKDLLASLKRPLELFVPFTPVVGPGLLQERQPLEGFLTGQYHKMPTIIGNTAQEATVFVYEAFTTPMSPLTYGIVLDLIFTLSKGGEVGAKYPVPPGVSDARNTASNTSTDGIFHCANRNMTRAVAVQNSPPLYYYLFDHPPSDSRAWGNATECYNVSCHGVELPFVFHAFYPGLFNWTQAEADLSVSMVTYWSNFAHTGNPNKFSAVQQQRLLSRSAVRPDAQVEWPQFSLDTQQTLHFMTPSNSLLSFYKKETCDWWDANIGYAFP